MFVKIQLKVLFLVVDFLFNAQTTQLLHNFNYIYSKLALRLFNTEV